MIATTACRGLVILLAAVQLAFGARPWSPQQSGLKLVASSEVVPTENGTHDGGAGLALVQEGQKIPAASGYPMCPPPETVKGSWGQRFLNACRSNPSAPRRCAKVTGEVVCPGKCKGGTCTVAFGDDSLYLCGKNDVRSHTKVLTFKDDDTTRKCKVLIFKATYVQKDGQDCACLPCRKDVVVRGVYGDGPDEFTSRSWAEVYADGSKDADTRSVWTYRWLDLLEASHRWNVWIGTHPALVTVIKISALVIIGAATGGIGSAAAVIAGVAWTAAMFALTSYNKRERIKMIENSGLSGLAKAACKAEVTATWVVGLVFSGAALFFPFSEELAAAAAESTSLAAFVSAQLDMANAEEAWQTLASYAAGGAQGLATTYAVQGAEKAVHVSAKCTDIIEISGPEVEEEVQSCDIGFQNSETDTTDSGNKHESGTFTDVVDA